MSDFNSKDILSVLSQNYYVIDCDTYKIIDSNNSDLKNGDVFCYQHIYELNQPCDKLGNGIECTCTKIKSEKSKVELVQKLNSNKGIIANKVFASPIFNKNGKITHIISQYINLSNEFELRNKLIIENNRLLSKTKKYEAIIEELKEKKENCEVLYKDLVEANNSIKDEKSNTKKVKDFFININETVQDGIWVSDENDILYYTNSVIKKIAGIPNIKLINKNVLTHFSKNTYREIIPYYLKVKSELEPLWYEIILKDSSGKDKYHNGWLTPLIKNNAFYGIICTVRDVTDRKEAEQHVEISEGKFKILSESSPMAVMMFQNNKWIYLNPMAEKITEYSIIELSEMNFWEIVHPDFKEIVRIRGEARQMGGMAPYNYEFKIITKSGNEKWVSLFGASTIFSGKPAGIVSVMDITDIKIAELALKDSEQKLRNITENSTNLFYQHTTDQMLTYLSPQVKEILGYTVDEAMIKWTDLTTDNPINEEGIKITKKAIKTGEAQPPFELELHHKSGKKIWVEVREAPLIEKGKTIAIVGAIADISDRKIAELELKESEERYRKLFETANVGIGISTISGEILDANSALERIFKYKKNELHNVRIEILYQNLDDRKFLIKKIKEKGEIQNLQIQMKTKTGTIIWVHISAQKFSVKYNDRLLFVVSDITKEKKAELEVFEYEKRFRTYIESSPVAIFIINENAEYVYVNNAVVKLLGYKKEDICKMTISDIKVKNKSNDLFDDFNDLKEMDLISGRETQYKAKNGKVVDVIIDAVKLSNKQYIAFCTDVSKLKYIEKKIKEKNEDYLSLNKEMEEYIIKLQELNKELHFAKEKAEESDKLKSAFLANMSHELRTPLNGILGFSTLMKRPGLSQESMFRYSDIIENSGKRLLNVVNDLFDISLIHSDQLKIEEDLFDVNTLLEEIYAFYIALKSNENEKIDFRLIKESIKEIKLINDKYRLHQIFKNLIDNAFKFTKEGFVEFGYLPINNEHITFYVKDSGIGIPNEFLETIFTSFKQVDDSKTRDYDGAGLGLAICSGLIERMGGEIWIDSKKEKGTTFYFTLPLNN